MTKTRRNLKVGCTRNGEKLIGYQVFRSPEGSGETYFGFATSLRQARRLMCEIGLHESMYGTAKAGGGICGLKPPSVPDNCYAADDDPISLGGDYNAVMVWRRWQRRQRLH
ncbi:MAG: hypothetical protein GXY83_15615 [Rhodopirellula sp.]|nr:hypothetical protein [Rhodopirellula sp.]